MKELNELNTFSKVNTKNFSNFTDQGKQHQSNNNHDIIREEIETQIELNCIMNKNIFSSDGYEYRVFECLACPGKLENICEFCFNNCHKDHNLYNKELALVDKTININKHYCDCALNNHDFGKQSKTSSVNYSSNQCSINDILALIDPKYYFYNTKLNIYQCLFCFLNCNGKESLNSLEEIDYLKLIQSSELLEHPKCQCSKSDSHTNVSDNITNLIYILGLKQFSEYFNKQKLLYQLITLPLI